MLVMIGHLENKSGGKTLLKEFCSEKNNFLSKEIIFQDKKISS